MRRIKGLFLLGCAALLMGCNTGVVRPLEVQALWSTAGPSVDQTEVKLKLGLKAQVTGPSVQAVEFLIDGAVVGSDQTEPYELQFAVSKKENYTYKYQVIAKTKDASNVASKEIALDLKEDFEKAYEQIDSSNALLLQDTIIQIQQFIKDGTIQNIPIETTCATLLQNSIPETVKTCTVKFDASKKLYSIELINKIDTRILYDSNNNSSSYQRKWGAIPYSSTTQWNYTGLGQFADLKLDLQSSFDQDNVQSVDFYIDGKLIGSDDSKPFEISTTVMPKAFFRYNYVAVAKLSDGKFISSTRNFMFLQEFFRTEYEKADFNGRSYLLSVVARIKDLIEKHPNHDLPTIKSCNILVPEDATRPIVSCDINYDYSNKTYEVQVITRSNSKYTYVSKSDEVIYKKVWNIDP